jgi:hypothetical protein
VKSRWFGRLSIGIAALALSAVAANPAAAAEADATDHIIQDPLPGYVEADDSISGVTDVYALLALLGDPASMPPSTDGLNVHARKWIDDDGALAVVITIDAADVLSASTVLHSSIDKRDVTAAPFNPELPNSAGFVSHASGNTTNQVMWRQGSHVTVVAVGALSEATSRADANELAEQQAAFTTDTFGPPTLNEPPGAGGALGPMVANILMVILLAGTVATVILLADRRGRSRRRVGASLGGRSTTGASVCDAGTSDQLSSQIRRASTPGATDRNGAR